MMALEGRHGRFDIARREYVITVPDTPTPWINYLGEGRYGGIVSNTGGGYSFDGDPRYKRVLRYRYNAVPEDQPGRYIYVRDDETGEFWSATWQPVKARYDEYQCRHGLGYTTITLARDGISTEVTYFVPVGERLELWWLKVRNRSGRRRRLSLFSYAEFSFFDAVKDQQNVDWVQQIQQGQFEDNFIFWNAFMRTWDYIFMTASLPAHSFDTSRDAFIGRYRDLANPIAVQTGACSGSLARRGNGTGSLCHKLEIPPGGEAEVVYALGVTPDPSQAKAKVPDLLKPKAVETLFCDLKDRWARHLATFQVETPDPDFDLMLNTWNPYQCKTTFNWSRFVSLYELGINRGMGLRDSSQDVLGVVHALPAEVRQLLLKLLACQFEDGHAYHLFYPLTGEGGTGEAQGGRYGWYSDDHLWLIEATVSYLKETGDLAFLDVEVPYAVAASGAGSVPYSGAASGQVSARPLGTVWEHLVRAIDFTFAHRGEHGLPLAGFADWNDALNLDHGKGRAESVWTGMLFCREAKLMAELSVRLGRPEMAARFREKADAVKEAINRHAWDGRWYIRAFDDDGRPVGAALRQGLLEGSHDGSASAASGHAEGEDRRLYLNPQSWAVISGVADEVRAGIALTNARDLLGTKYGFVLVYPAYRAYDPNVGGISTYPPGAKENGGVFLHSNTWFIIAELMAGRIEEAYEHYRRILPVTWNADTDVREVEPYVYCQNILGKEHPEHGVGRNSWLTGTASWAYVVGTQYVLGVRPDYDGLVLDPRVPASWNEFTVRRRFRGRELVITFRRSAEKAIFVNGKRADSDRFVPIADLESERPNEILVHF